MTDRIERIDNQIVQINRRLETHERKKRELNHELKAIKDKLRSANTYGSTKKLKDDYNNQIVKKTNEIGKVDADILKAFLLELNYKLNDYRLDIKK